MKDIFKQVNMFSGFKLFFFVLFLFPSINFGLFTAEIFPWAIIGSVLFQKSYSKEFIIILYFFFFSWAISLLLFGPTDTIRSAGAYINVLYVFAFMLTISQLELIKFIKLIRIIFILLLLLGLLQYFHLVNFTDGVIKFLIPRGSSEAFSLANRGVRLLSTEPARAGNEMIFFYLLIRSVYIKTKYRLLSDIFMTIYLIVIIQSFMAVSFMVIFLFLNIKFKSILVFVFCSLLLVYSGITFSGGRTVDLLTKVFEIGNFNEILFFITNSSGQRLITIYSSYIYGVRFPFGAGLGNWFNGSINAIEMTGIDVSKFAYFQLNGDGDVTGTRSSGYLSNLILETGLIGFLFVLHYIFKSLKNYWNISKDSKIIILMFLFKILFIGSVGHPIAWIMVVLILRYMNFEKKNRNNLNII
jgi:hypothetical protein